VGGATNCALALSDLPLADVCTVRDPCICEVGTVDSSVRFGVPLLLHGHLPVRW